MSLDKEAPDSGAVPVQRRSHFVDLSPFRESPAFLRLWIGTHLAGIGSQMTIVAVGLHLYEITQSTSAVALVGVVSLIPMILAGLYGGVLVDSFDRRTVAIIAETVAWLSTISLALLAWFDVEILVLYYVATTLTAMAVTIVGAARSAIVPRLLPTRLLPAAGGLNGIGFGFQVILGPAAAGILVASVGVQWTFTADAVLFLAAFVGVITLPPIRPEGSSGLRGFAALREGLSFLRRAPNIRMSFLVDIVAMTFGMPRVILPAVGALVIGGGAVTVGVLLASFAAGALIAGVFSGRLGGVRWHGIAIRNSIMVFGGFTLGFGVVLALTGTRELGALTDSFADANMPALVAAGILLAGAGGADQVSSVFRTTMLQAAVPDNMRGRTQGVFIVVVTGGPRVGDAYVGIVAATTLLWLPSLLGGVLIIGLVYALVARHASFAGYDAQNPTY
ncbi:MAG: MFS transporter [Microbacteriaceae bacterium]